MPSMTNISAGIMDVNIELQSVVVVPVPLPEPGHPGGRELVVCSTRLVTTESVASPVSRSIREIVRFALDSVKRSAL